MTCCFMSSCVANCQVLCKDPKEIEVTGHEIMKIMNWKDWVEYMQDKVQETCLNFESHGSCTRELFWHFDLQGHCEKEA